MKDVRKYLYQLNNRSPDVLHVIEQQNVIGDRLTPIIGADCGRLLNALVENLKPLTIVELGTGCGYATIWLAKAAMKFKGKIITIDSDSHMLNVAQKNIEQAGVMNNVQIIQADAPTWVKSHSGRVDFILQDTDPALYSSMLNDCIAFLNPHGMMVTHDALLPILGVPPQLATLIDQFNSQIYNHKSLTSTLLPVGDGLWMSVKGGC